MFADAVEPAGEEPIDEIPDDDGKPGDEDLQAEADDLCPSGGGVWVICLAFDIASKTGVAHGRAGSNHPRSRWILARRPTRTLFQGSPHDGGIHRPVQA